MKNFVLAIAVLGVLPLTACLGSDDPESPTPDDPVRAVQGQDGLYVALDRPPTVPAEYLATPNGYFHPSCVHAIAGVSTPRSRISRSMS